MSWFLGVIGLRGGSARRAFAAVRLATEEDVPAPAPVAAAPAVAAAAQEARADVALSAVVGKKR